MKKSGVIIRLTIVFMVFSAAGDQRFLSLRERIEDFYSSEQKAFKWINDTKDSRTKFTGVQYAALQNYYMTLDPEILRVPQERLPRAMNRAKQSKQNYRRKAAEEFPVLWTPLESDMGGRTRAIMWDPNDPMKRKVWAAGVTGGLWYRENIFDDSQTWQIVEGSEEFLNINTLTHDPLNTQVFYAGMGEGQTARIIYRESGGRGPGILKSSDGGTSWELLESTLGFQYVNDIVIREEEGKSVVYAGVSSGKYQGVEIESTPGDGLYRSDDGGESWTQVLPNIQRASYSYAVSDIEISASGRLFVGTGINLQEQGAGKLLYSDDGLNWVIRNEFSSLILDDPVYNYPGRVMLAASPSDPDRIYALFTAAGEDFYSFKSPWCRYIFKTDDGGETWEETGMPEADGGWAYIAWHALTATVNPGNPDILYAGGLDLHKSSNAGQSWEPFSLWYNFQNNPNFPDYVHADHHSIKFQPGSSSVAIFSTDGGVFLSTNMLDPVPNVTEKNQGFGTLQYYSCAIHPDEGVYNFLAGAQDNGTVSYNDPDRRVNIFDNVSYGDGTFCFIDEDNPDFQITTSQFNYIYYSTNAFTSDEGYNVGGNALQTGIFLNPMDYDSRNDILYSNDCDFFGQNADQLVRTYNFEFTPLSSTISLGMNLTVPLSAIKVSPYSLLSTTVYAGSQDGRLFRIRNANWNIDGNSFTPQINEIGSPDFPPGNIVCVEIGQTEDQIMVIFSNYGVTNIWETRDAGATWKEKEMNLPDMPVRWGIYNPKNYNEVILATEAGLWTTKEFGNETFEWNAVPGFPNVRVDMLKIRKSDNAMVAATHGRGLWYGSAFPLGSEETDGEDELEIYPNPASTEIRIRVPSQQVNTDYSLRIFDLQGREVKHIPKFNSQEATERNVNIAELEGGRYIISLVSGQKRYTSLLIKTSE